MLMRPTPLVTDLTLGVLARAARLYPLEIHAFCFLSNHFHLLVTVESAQRLSAFMNYLNSNLAREIGRVVNWRERFWGRRYQAVLVDDDEVAQVERLSYLLQQGTKEGLVRSPRDWPGANSTRALLTGEPVMGRWCDRTLLHRARRQRVAVEEGDLWTPESLELRPLPVWRGLPSDAYRQRIETLVRAIESWSDARTRSTGVEPIGVDRIRRHSPHQKSKQLRRTRVPLVHAASSDARFRWRRRYQDFAAAFWRSAFELRSAAIGVLFPAGSFPPAPPFVESTA